MYIPRYLFGDFINKRVKTVIEKAAKNKTVTVTTLKAEAIDLTLRSGEMV